MTEQHNKTAVAYLIAAGIALVVIAALAVLVRWPGPTLEVVGALTCLYLYHLLAQAVRATLP